MRTSFSQHSTFVRCSKYWHNSYVQKLEPIKQGASLFFGSAIDACIMSLLKNEPNWRKKFYDRWEMAVVNNKLIKILDNPDIVYSNSDCDVDLLDNKDLLYLKESLQEFELITEYGMDPIEAYKSIVKVKKNSFKVTKELEIKYFNRCSYISMTKKGKLLIESFYEQFYPRIEKVLATQLNCSISDPNSGDSITGVIDMILKLKDNPNNIIFDLKTSAGPYDQNNIELSQQLTLYAAMKGVEYQTSQVGFVVLNKNIPKEIVANCQKCGYIKNGRHQTCNAEVNGVRCNGEWNETKIPKPEVQVLIEQRTTQQIEELLQDMSTVMLGMKNNIIYKNVEQCSSWYGSDCPYKKYCHKNDSSGLRKKGEK